MWGPILALAASAWVEADHAKARLIADDAIAPGGSATVALELVAEDGWHTYWRNPGDAGMATSVAWTLPKGWTASELAWPAPQRHEEDQGRIATYGYEGRVVLPATLGAPKGAKRGAKKTATIRAKASWLVCREICLPGEADLTLKLPVKAGATRAELVTLPAEPGWTAELTGWTLRVQAPVAPGASAYFFPETPGLVDPSAAQTLTKLEGGGYSIDLPRAANASLAGVKELKGVLVSGEDAWRITAKVKP